MKLQFKFSLKKLFFFSILLFLCVFSYIRWEKYKKFRKVQETLEKYGITLSLKEMLNVEKIDFSSTSKKVETKDLDLLKILPKLKELNLKSVKIIPNGFVEIPNLSIIDLSESNMVDINLISFGELKNISTLNLSNTKIAGYGFEFLNKCSHLSILYLNNCPNVIGHSIVCIVRHIPNISKLSLSGNIHLYEGLTSLNKLTNLVYLDLSHTPITDNGLLNLKELTNLTYLNLSHTSITDNGLLCLKELTNLTYLNLSHTSITDNGLLCLKELTNLAYLNLNIRDNTNR